MITLQFVTNFLVIYFLETFVNFFINTYLKPSTFFNKDEMNLQDVIKINTTSWGKNAPIYDSETYQIRYDFEITFLKLFFTFLLYIIFLQILFWSMAFFPSGLNILFLEINFIRIFHAAVLLCIYFGILICGGIWIYDRKNYIHNRDSFIYPVLSIVLFCILVIFILKSLISI
ncbi:MAG: hypothetical protein Q7R95_07370 [bacterium]|nr:hypothetical protein [bacterium]